MNRPLSLQLSAMTTVLPRLSCSFHVSEHDLPAPSVVSAQGATLVIVARNKWPWISLKQALVRQGWYPRARLVYLWTINNLDRRGRIRLYDNIAI